MSEDRDMSFDCDTGRCMITDHILCIVNDADEEVYAYNLMGVVAATSQHDTVRIFYSLFEKAITVYGVTGGNVEHVSDIVARIMT